MYILYWCFLNRKNRRKLEWDLQILQTVGTKKKKRKEKMSLPTGEVTLLWAWSLQDWLQELQQLA